MGEKIWIFWSPYFLWRGHFFIPKYLFPQHFF